MRVVAYVDGFNLYHGVHSFSGRRDLWLDLAGLLSSLLRPGQSLVEINYFTAPVVGSGWPSPEISCAQRNWR